MNTWMEINAWRKERRIALIAQRVALNPETRRAAGERVNKLIEEGFPLLKAMVIGFCWPYMGEIDARFVVRHFRDLGAVSALPVVVEKKRPLIFRKWWPGAPMGRGVYDIPFPEGTETLVPDAVIVPMVGLDEQAYRLGYGGGFFDRTLAHYKPPPIAIGVVYEIFRMPTIYPQPHDISMDFVVIEKGVHAVKGSKLITIDSDECAQRFQQLALERGLPRRTEYKKLPLCRCEPL